MNLFSVWVTFLVVLTTASTSFGAKSCENAMSNPSLPVIRFESQIEKLESVLLQKKNVDAIIDEMVSQDSRGVAFKIEGLSRIYQSAIGEPFDQIRDQVKELEDALGHYTEMSEYVRDAQKWKAPKKAIGILEEQVVERKKELAQFLRQKGWLLSETFENLKSQIADADFEKSRKDQRKFLKEVAKELEDISLSDFDMDNLQDGIHELRRQLRWVLIYFQASNGLFTLSDGLGSEKVPLHEYSYLVTHPLAQGPFSKLPENPRVKTPAVLPQHLFLALSKLVQEIGVAKSYGESIEVLAQAFQKSGLAKSKETAREKALALAAADPGFVDPVLRAKSIKKEIKRTDILTVLAEIIRDQRDEI